jgi:DNA-binding Lrp family transcriptional regulator
VNGIFDRILPSLKPTEQLVLLRLYRLTRGFNKETCRVTIGKLATSCNIGTTATRLAVQALENRGYIRRIGTDVANTNQNNRGIDFEMLLPAAAPTRRVGATRPVAPTLDVAPTPNVANKINTIKENTQTQEPAAGVRVGSRFTIEECRSYALHLQSTGQGINNPGGYATTIHRTGEADELIDRFLNPTVSTHVDTSQCPDCKGSGFYYPNGPAGGVAKCKHEKLNIEN